MAHALSITDGTITFSLSTTNAYLIFYVPTEAQPGEQSVTESVEIMFYAASASAMQTAIQSLQRWQVLVQEFLPPDLVIAVGDQNRNAVSYAAEVEDFGYSLQHLGEQGGPWVEHPVAVFTCGAAGRLICRFTSSPSHCGQLTFSSSEETNISKSLSQDRQVYSYSGMILSPFERL